MTYPRVMDEIHSNEFSTEKVLKSTKKYWKVLKNNENLTIHPMVPIPIQESWMA